MDPEGTIYIGAVANLVAERRFTIVQVSERFRLYFGGLEGQLVLHHGCLRSLWVVVGRWGAGGSRGTNRKLSVYMSTLSCLSGLGQFSDFVDCWCEENEIDVGKLSKSLSLPSQSSEPILFIRDFLQRRIKTIFGATKSHTSPFTQLKYS